MPSTVIAYTNYDAAKKILRVTFLSGSIYEYKNVEEKVYINYKKSFSKGTFLNQQIKGKYTYEKIK
jgi:hypothetical protein